MVSHFFMLSPCRRPSNEPPTAHSPSSRFGYHPPMEETGETPHASETGAVCGTHADVAAVATCARCGTYLCRACVGFTEDDRRYCRACTPRVGPVTIPWEDGTRPMRRRFIDTVRVLTMAPADTYSRLARGSIVHALAFAGLAGLIPGVLIGGMLAALFGCIGVFSTTGPPETASADAALVGGMLLVSVLAPFATALSSLFYAFLNWGPYHLAAKALGGQGTAGESLRASAYVQVLQLSSLPLLVLSYIPLIGIVFSLVLLGYIAGYMSYALYHHAIGHHELEQGRAILAGGAPILFWVFFFALLMTAAFMLSFAPLMFA